MELAEDRPRAPKPPRLGHVIAVILVGLVLCAAYAWFSASWALFRHEG